MLRVGAVLGSVPALAFRVYYQLSRTETELFNLYSKPPSVGLGLSSLVYHSTWQPA